MKTVKAKALRKKIYQKLFACIKKQKSIFNLDLIVIFRLHIFPMMEYRS